MTIFMSKIQSLYLKNISSLKLVLLFIIISETECLLEKPNESVIKP